MVAARAAVKELGVGAVIVLAVYTGVVFAVGVLVGSHNAKAIADKVAALEADVAYFKRLRAVDVASSVGALTGGNVGTPTPNVGSSTIGGPVK